MSTALHSVRNLVIAVALGLIFAGSATEIASGIRTGIIAPIGNFIFGGSPTLKVGPFDIGQAFGSLISGISGFIAAVLILALLLRCFWHPASKLLRIESSADK